VTTCTRNRLSLFGEIALGEIQLNEIGRIAERVWRQLPEHYLHVRLDGFVVMPNHFHSLIIMKEDQVVPAVGAGLKPVRTRLSAFSAPQRHGLPEIIRAFKTFSARQINQFRNTPGTPVWQRGYYEHIVRDEDELNRIRQYIWSNPEFWEDDIENLYGGETECW